MATVFNLATPVNVGGLTPIFVGTLKVTAISFSTTPALAQIGTAELTLTLTDPASGWQETLKYQDASVLAFFAQSAPAPDAGASVEDVMAKLVFTKLIADGKLPPGTIAQA